MYVCLYVDYFALKLDSVSILAAAGLPANFIDLLNCTKSDPKRRPIDTLNNNDERNKYDQNTFTHKATCTHINTKKNLAIILVSVDSLRAYLEHQLICGDDKLAVHASIERAKM